MKVYKDYQKYIMSPGTRQVKQHAYQCALYNTVVAVLNSAIIVYIANGFDKHTLMFVNFSTLAYYAHMLLNHHAS